MSRHPLGAICGVLQAVDAYDKRLLRYDKMRGFFVFIEVVAVTRFRFSVLGHGFDSRRGYLFNRIVSHGVVFSWIFVGVLVRMQFSFINQTRHSSAWPVALKK